MFDLQTWQVAAIGIVAVASVGWMTVAIVRLFARRAGCASQSTTAAWWWPVRGFRVGSRDQEAHE